MKKNILYLLLFLGITSSYSQTTIAVQSFETSGDTWNPLSFSTTPCTVGNDVWDYTTNLPGITPNDGIQFWGIRDLDGSCGGDDFETITLPNVNILSFSDVTFSFDYYAIGFDNSEDLKYELFYDNVSQGEVIVVNGVNDNSDNTNGWLTENVSIPNTVTNISVIFSAKCNANSERAGFDNIRLAESTNTDCANAITLTVGQNNTENIVTSTNVNAGNSGELPVPNCGNYRGDDVWFTTLVPASGLLTIETLNVGGITDTGIAAYTGSCGSLIQIDCDDNGGSGQLSMISITNLPNTTIYIRVWEKNNNNFGNFGIVVYTTICPFSTTWNGSSWNSGIPNSFTSAIINANYDTASNGNFDSCNCTINSGNTVNVTANNYINIENDLTVSGILEVRHEGSLVMVDDDGNVNVSGTINIHKTSTQFNQFDYMYWSSPTINETISSALSSSESTRIYKYHHKDGWLFVNGTTIMEQGIGYIAMGDTSGTFPKTQSVIFDGVVNNGTILTPIGKSPNIGITNFDWNLIGNPYPSAIDANALLSNPQNTSTVKGSIYLWTHNTQISDTNSGPNTYNYSSNDYASFTAGTGGVAAISGGPVPNGFIASGQAFFIQAIDAGNITFNNSMRVTNNNNQLFKSKSNEEKDRIWLNLFNDKGAFSQILVGFIDGATDGIDRSYDGPKFGGNYISFYSIIEDLNFAIQGRPSITDEENIKLGFYSYIEENDSLKIGISNLEGKLNDYNVYLKDKLLNLNHDLKISDYSFIVSESGVFNDRFELLFTKSEILNVDENSIINEQLILLNKENTIEVRTNNGTNINNLKVYDLLGKLIFDLNPNSNSFSINTQNLLEGTVLLFNATLETNYKLSKKFIIY